ncbi:hypothetical protein [Clostridium tertium]|nr:hypothetical protein [Clostridium tertium]
MTKLLNSNNIHHCFQCKSFIMAGGDIPLCLSDYNCDLEIPKSENGEE